MERLTNAKEAAAQRRAYEKRLEQGYPRNIPEERFLKLAAYEDTGLEPGDIKRAFTEDTILKMAGAILGVSPDRIRELAQADQEGRCVVTELVPGDKVWVVERDEDGTAVDFCGMIFVTSVNGAAIVSPTINGCADLDFILSDFVEETVMNCSGDFSGYPVSDCYSIREEAEAALMEEEV